MTGFRNQIPTGDVPGYMPDDETWVLVQFGRLQQLHQVEYYYDENLEKLQRDNHLSRYRFDRLQRHKIATEVQTTAAVVSADKLREENERLQMELARSSGGSTTPILVGRVEKKKKPIRRT